MELQIDSENKLRSQLDRARSARPYGGIGRSYIWSRATTTERLHRGIVQAEPVLSAVRIGEVRMIQNVEEFGPELEPHGFSEMEILGQREIKVPKTGVLEHVSTHVSELAERRRKHD